MTADGGDGSRNSAGTADSSGRPAGVPRCPRCDAPMYARHCKYVCPHHGVVIDCSDPFR